MTDGDDISRTGAVPSQRVHALDALRALAMFGVVIMHAQLSYMDHPYGPPVWAIYDHPASRALSLSFWFFHPFRLPLFFFVGGFFAAQLYATRGAAAFLRQRTERILVPFLVGSVVLLPVIFYVFAAGWWLSGLCTWDEIRRVRFDPSIQADLFGPVHLWFLEYLFLYCLALLGVRWWRPTERLATADPAVSWRDRCLASPWRPLWCALPTALVLAFDADALISHRNSFLPSLFQFLHFAVFFACGVRFYRFRHDLGRFVAGSGVYLVLALPLFWVVEPLIQAHRQGTLGRLDHILLPLTLAVFAWLCLFGFLGLFQSLFTRPDPRLRYLSDAAYWVYLSHLPIVAVLQIALAQLPGPGLVKWILVVTVTTSFCLWSYDRYVRYSAIGAVLHGRRQRPVPPNLTAIDGVIAPVSA
jgi:glucans biosynthesis protein C